MYGGPNNADFPSGRVTTDLVLNVPTKSLLGRTVNCGVTKLY